MNKRASFVVDLIAASVVLLGIGLVLVLGAKIGSEMNASIQESHPNSYLSDYFNRSWSETRIAYTAIDYLFIFIAIGMTIAVPVSAWKLKTHPLFLPLSFVGLAIAITMAANITNIYERVTNDSELETVRDVITPNTAFVMSILPLVILITGAASIIITYARFEQTGGGKSIL